MTIENEVEIPSYVTDDVLGRIKEMIGNGEIHPKHYACDMTAEMAAGAPVGEVILNASRRKSLGDKGSIYRKLFPYD